MGPLPLNLSPSPLYRFPISKLASYAAPPPISTQYIKSVVSCYNVARNAHTRGHVVIPIEFIAMFTPFE